MQYRLWRPRWWHQFSRSRRKFPRFALRPKYCKSWTFREPITFLRILRIFNWKYECSLSNQFQTLHRASTDWKNMSKRKINPKIGSEGNHLQSQIPQDIRALKILWPIERSPSRVQERCKNHYWNFSSIFLTYQNELGLVEWRWKQIPEDLRKIDAFLIIERILEIFE
jgi:hypothetical protein